MKKILITGSNGYIGRHVTRNLLDKGYRVLVADNKIDGLDSRAEICKEPIFSGNENIYEELGRPDICIHMAWRNGFIHNSSTHMLELSKHYEFIENMVKGGLKHLVVIGTMHEVGYWEGMINENTPCNPMSLYGIAKNTLRQSLEVMLKEKDVIFQWLRLYYIMGDDTKSNSIFSKIIAAENEGKKEFPFTSGKNKYDFIDVEILAEQIALASTQEHTTGIINCCTGTPISLADKVEQFIEKNNLDIKLKYGAFPDREYDSPEVWGDNSKIKEIIYKNNLKMGELV